MFSLFNRVVQFFAIFSLFFMVTDCSLRTEMWRLYVRRSGGCCFCGARLSAPAFSLLIYIKLYLYLEYNTTFPVDDRHTAHVEKRTNGMLCLYAHYGGKKKEQNDFFQSVLRNGNFFYSVGGF